MVLTNPPWDRRLENAEESWDKLSHFLEALQQQSRSIDPATKGELDEESLQALSTPAPATKQPHKPTTAWVLSGNPSCPEFIHLKPKGKMNFATGVCDLQLLKYSL